MKLFEEIRIDEKLAEPKKKYKRVKKDDDGDKPKVKYTLLREEIGRASCRERV